MYTPGEIRAAERLQAVLPNKFPEHDIDVCDLEAVLPAILRHRADDYDAEGMPLPVDDAFCIEMGAEPYDQPDNLTCLVWEDDRGWLISKGVFGQWYVYGNELPEGAWPKTRPQLRALIEVMG